jgi:antitoxin component YwqK of YwqJK toxin-antitoxin module
MWYACQSAAGKKKVQKAKIRQLTCEGSSNPNQGSLTVRKGVITVKVGGDEAKPYLRSAKEFQRALNLKLKFKSDDPYYDDDWSKLRNEKNPVTDKRSYCAVNGEKFDLELGGFKDLERELNGKHGTVKCWRNGKAHTDIRVDKSGKSGLDINMYVDHYTNKMKDTRISNYRNGEQHGYQSRETDAGLAEESFFEDGKIVWHKEYHYSDRKYGSLKVYSYSVPGQYATRATAYYNEDGSLSSITCKPGAGGDPVFRKLCGFDGAVVTKTFQKKGVPRQEYKFKDGLLDGAQSKERDGLKSTVKYRAGKKDGLEKFVNKAGETKLIISWKNGDRDGTLTRYDDKQNRVIQVQTWKADTLVNETLYYLNKHKRRYTEFVSEQKRNVTEYHDNGKVSDQGMHVVCKMRYWSYFCEEGKHTSYFENGQIWSVGNYAKGERIGTHKGYYENGRVRQIEVYKDDHLEALQLFDSTGKKTLDEKYEADGSRK